MLVARPAPPVTTAIPRYTAIIASRASAPAILTPIKLARATVSPASAYNV